MGIGNQISSYYKSFSGTDTLAFILMPGCTPVVIGSLTTISYSMFRNKKPVINIGRTNINGVTRGSRIYAGTMIFTLINQHWLKELQEQVAYLKDFPELKVDELPLFDIMIVSANEYGNAVSMYIYGIDFTDEAQTISVEDLFTENTFSFVARDISTFKSITKQSQTGGKSYIHNTLNQFVQRLYVLKSSTVTFDELGRLAAENFLEKLVDMQRPQTYTLARVLYLCTSRLMMGNDVAMIQTLLSRIFPDISINGAFDEAMDALVRKYQSLMGLDIDGIVDDRLYNHLLNNSLVATGIRLGIIVNRSGTFGYRNMSLNSNVQYSFTYREQVEISEIMINDLDGYEQRWYLTNKGYVMAEDVYSALDENRVTEFPIITYGDTSVYTNIIQAALKAIYPDFFFTAGVLDAVTVDKIKQLQRENGLYESGDVDNETWLLLQTLSGSIRESITDDNFQIVYSKVPDHYHIANKTLVQDLSLFKVSVGCNVKMNVKSSVVLHFPNGHSITKSQDILVEERADILLESFKSAFVYNPKEGSCPNCVEWVIYPYNKQSYKWTLYYDE